MLKRILCSVLVFTSNSTIAQQPETSKWYFGVNAGLDFSIDPPAVLTGMMVTNESCAAIADNNGNLLFYSDGENVWNSQHQVMANGSSLMGDMSSTQGALIVRKPGSQSLYYLFTACPASGLRYSVVDMSLAAGLGSVTAVKNLLLQSSVTEQMSAVRHCNGTDVWVMVHEENSKNYCAYLVTSAGVNATPVISNVGHYQGSGGFVSFFISLKFSPNGKKLAASLKDSLFIFDFNPSTGIVSNFQKLGSGLGGMYVPEFSPDGTKLYAARSVSPTRLLQWDLCSGIPSVMAASQTTIFTAGATAYALQLANNGKIYLALIVSDSLGVIHNPNALGAACNFSFNGQALQPNKSYQGLPNFICSLFLQSAPPFSYTVDCMQSQFIAAPPYASGSSCAATNFYTVSGITWDFGDPASGSANTSTLTAPTHSFSAPGIYNVKLAYETACGADTIRKTLSVGLPPQYTLTGANSVCAGGSLTISTTGNDSLNWYLSDSAITAYASGNTLVNSLPAAGTYTWYAALPSCTVSGARQAFTVQAHPFPVISVTPVQPTICAGEQTVLTASGAPFLSWQNTTPGPSATFQPMANTVYSVSGTSAHGCVSSATVEVVLNTCLRLDEGEHTLPLTIYPNPAAHTFSIRLPQSGINGSVRIMIFTANGQLLRDEVLAVNGSSLNLQQPAGRKGIHFVRITSGTDQFSGSVIFE